MPPAIPAATVVLLRDSDDGIRVLMLRRSLQVGFAGMWVFPGGRIDAIDRQHVDHERMAAARELAEETGMILEPSLSVPLARWTPPPVIRKRFDTMFFVARA